MTEFPKLMIEPGSYACVIEHPGGQRLTAQLDVKAGQNPRGEIFGWPLEEHDGYRVLPQPAERFSLLKGDLRMGLEVLLLDVTVEPWFPERAHLGAEIAVVGHGLFLDPERSFSEASLQITEGHRLFGTVPINSVTWPGQIPDAGKAEFTAQMDGNANVTHSIGDTELRCRYWLTTTLMDYFRFQVTTAPVFEVKNATRLAPADWMRGHVLPLRELVTLATLEPQTVAWVMLDEDYEDPRGQTSTRTYQLFSQDIAQAPYAPIRDPLKDGRTLFTFRDLPYSPVDLMRRWEDLRRTHHGFIQPLMQGLTKQMTPRARFLSLVQALEGLHTQTVGEGPIPVDEHRARRKALLRAVKDAGLPKTDLGWLDHWLDRYGRFTLEERLVQLCDAVREDIGNIVDLSCVPGDIRQVRNRLSHGTEDYQWPVLRPSIQAMSAIGVAHVLHLLDLPRNRLAQVFGQG